MPKLKFMQDLTQENFDDYQEYLNDIAEDYEFENSMWSVGNVNFLSKAAPKLFPKECEMIYLRNALTNASILLPLERKVTCLEVWNIVDYMSLCIGMKDIIIEGFEVYNFTVNVKVKSNDDFEYEKVGE